MRYCEEYAALLDLFVDGELPPEELERVREHLAGCPGCQAYVDDAMTIRAGFPEVEETAVPEGFAESVMERIRASGGESRAKRSPFRRWIGPAAALAACCALVVLAGNGGGTNGSPAAPAGGAMTSVYGSAADTGAAPQMAEDAEESVQVTTAAREGAYDTADTEAENSAVENAEEPLKNRMAAAAPSKTESAAAAPEEKAAADVDGAEEMALCLTAQEAGNLLDGFTPEQENASERRYTLSLEEYETLLEALGRWEKLPDTPGGSFQVVVTGPF